MNFSKYITFFLLLFLFISIGILSSCKKYKQKNNTNSKYVNIQLFAAAGTMLPSNEICNSFEIERNITIERNYAASGALARQIKAGAEADLYISANKEWINYLIENKIITKDNITKIAKNKLVIICKKDASLKIEFSNDFDIKSAIHDNISIGDPKYVPVGKYAKQALDSLGWFNQIQNKIILAKDVTSVLHYVEMGECDWGIVYYSEAIKSDKIKIAYEIPMELYDPIVFYIALLNDNPKTRALYQYYKSDTAKYIFIKNGFNE
jgi:molybdate transport system substrate-binding protein